MRPFLILCQIVMIAVTGLVHAESGRNDKLPYISASYTIVPPADFDQQQYGEDLETKEVRLTAGFYRHDGDAMSWDVGLDYQYTRYVFSGVDGRNRDLHWLQVPVGFSTDAGGWRFDGYVAPGIFTSSNVMKDFFDEGSGDDFAIAGRVEALRETGGNIDWLIGLGYDRSFGEPRFYPLAGLVYAPSEDLRIRLAFPDSSFRFRSTDRQTWTVRLFPAGNEWHVVSDELDDEFDFSVEAWRGQAWWSFSAWRQLFVDVSVGYEFDRHYDFIDDTGQRINSGVDDEFVFAVGLRFGPAPIPFGQQTRHRF